MTHRWFNTWVLLGGLCGATAALAGPDWKEVGDAGSTPATAQVPGGNGPISSIRGKLQGPGPNDSGSPDFEDMYLINIDSPTDFCAITVPDKGLVFDTQLWLFKFDGTGLLGNDNSGPTPLSALGPESNDGSGAMIVADGRYYIAISGGNTPLQGRDPFSNHGPIFNQADPQEISGPDGPGGQFAIENWNGQGQIGDYQINLCATSFVSGIPALPPWGMALLAGFIITIGAIVISMKR